MYRLKAYYIALLGVSVAYHHFVSGYYIKLIKPEGPASFRVGMAVEIANVHDEHEDLMYHVMTFYRSGDFNPEGALEKCWPGKKVIVQHNDLKGEAIQIKVTVIATPDDIKSHLYDPSNRPTAPQWKELKKTVPNGGFGPCWRVTGFFEDILSDKQVFFPPAWLNGMRETKDGTVALLDLETFLSNAPPEIYFYEITDESETIYVGDKSGAQKTSGHVESGFIYYLETKLANVAFKDKQYSDQDFTFADTLGIPEECLKDTQVSKEGDLCKRTGCLNYLTKDVTHVDVLTMTISSKPPVHIAVPMCSEDGKDVRSYIRRQRNEWGLPYSLFKGYTIIIDNSAGRRRYKFILPKESTEEEKKRKEKQMSGAWES
ncbi:hypothetical protein ABG067_004838 [Albugo candida]